MTIGPTTIPMTAPLCFQYEEFKNTSETINHSHQWGQFNTIDQGVMEINVSERLLISPCDHAIWIPPNIEHQSQYKQAQRYCSIYIEPEHALRMPSDPCIVAIDPVSKSILGQFSAWGTNHIDGHREQRLAHVLIDQFSHAPTMPDFLPNSQDKLLAPILTELQQNPADKRTLKEWASVAYTTERTLARRCKKELNMTFNDWKQRLLFITALRMLKQSTSVQDIAFELGYSSSSAFIAMFRRHAGTSPEQYTRQWHHVPAALSEH
ncbi:helix-turn-helix transcriptional regulator [Vibrio profundum]|uniref:AraC family transcriptional regulator n=1 Tax=Vibrio profundum TaxID=2910247 RepID=UPI003D12CC79